MYHTQFNEKIDHLKRSGQYRKFTTVNRIAGKYPNAHVPDKHCENLVVNWCCNDYLGMSQHPDVISSMIKTTKLHGAGSGGSRNIGGTHSHYIELEKSIAEWHQKESALVFPTGYSSNDATIQCLLRSFPDTIVFSDEKNHASIINGIRSTPAEKRIFRHNDTEHLENLLSNEPIERFKIIIFESIYSMDGDIAPVRDIIKLAKKYNALTYIDEVHAIGMYGDTGAGIASKLNIAHEIDIIQGTMAKGVGVIGGYIAASDTIVDFIRSFSSGFIFTTSLPPGIVSACLTSIEYLKKSSVERELLKIKTETLRDLLDKNGIPVMKCSNSHILPILIGDSKKCRDAAKYLLDENNIYIQPINSPTVEKGTERFRVNVTPNHTDWQILSLVNSLVFVFNKFHI